MANLKDNLTIKILQKAEDERYGILAGVAYDGGQALALVRAFEAKRSPGMLLLFPLTVHQLGGSFLKYCLDM